MAPCEPEPRDDFDGDGFTGADGDCNDCDPRINPAAIETADNGGSDGLGVDEDCNGFVDDVAPPCDGDVATDTTDPLEAARAIDLCRRADKPSHWGLVQAAFVRADGTSTAANDQIAVSSRFGFVRPRTGTRLLVMSTGRARTPDQPGACGSDSCQHDRGTTPDGYPSPVPGCPRSTTINDDIGLEVKVRAPSNARGYDFELKVHSFEFPEWVCTAYNDELFVKAMPPPPGAASNGNLVFDALSNPMSVNHDFFDVCFPALRDDFASQCTGTCPDPPEPYCPLGIQEMTGTGFGTWGNAGATRWLRTEASIVPGEEVTLRFAIFDTGDGKLDSTATIDGFRWITDHQIDSVRTDVAP